MTKSPLVSVVVPHFNHGAYLKQRLDSILDQTFQDFEILLLDDGSTDNGPEIIQDYAARYECISAELRSENSGNPFAQWKRGVERAKGTFIWIAESDDSCSGNFLATVLEPLLQRESIGISYTATQLIDESGSLLDDCVWVEKDKELRDRWQNNFINSGQAECAEYLIRGNTLPNASAVVFRKSLYERCGGVDLSLRYAGDWLLWSKILLESDIAYSAQRLNFQRKHRESTTHKSFSDPLHFFEYHKVRQCIIMNTEVRTALCDMCKQQYQSDILSQLLIHRVHPVGIVRMLSKTLLDRRQHPKFSFISLLGEMLQRVWQKFT